MRMLKELGADMNKATNDGTTPAFIASQKGYVEVVRVLGQLGVDLNKARNDGTTPALIASQKGHVDLLRVLNELGADLNKARNDGATPAYIASQHGHVACPGNLPYGTSKAAAVYMTKQIAVDYAAEHVACNAVAPGKIVKEAPHDFEDLAQQGMTDADNFTMSYPKDIDPRLKAAMAAALLLIDYQFFEDEGDCYCNPFRCVCGYKCCVCSMCGCLLEWGICFGRRGGDGPCCFDCCWCPCCP